MSIFSICRAIRKITNAELDEMAHEAKSQSSYFSPLKMATQTRMSSLGAYNMRVLKLLRELRDTMNAGPKP